jgi:uncharacterized protein
MKKEHLSEIVDYMESFAKDSAHDADHIHRVLNHALIVAKNYEVNMDILVAACLLHDIGRPAQFADPRQCHAKVGSEMAYNFLKKLGWQENDCAQVRHCVLTHRFRTNAQPETIEAKILFDADKLDVIGALGIARTLQYEGKMNAPLDEFIKEYDRKLSKLYDIFYTKEAKQTASSGKMLLEEFYCELITQLDTSVAEAYLSGQKAL